MEFTHIFLRKGNFKAFTRFAPKQFQIWIQLSHLQALRACLQANDPLPLLKLFQKIICFGGVGFPNFLQGVCQGHFFQFSQELLAWLYLGHYSSQVSIVFFTWSFWGSCFRMLHVFWGRNSFIRTWAFTWGSMQIGPRADGLPGPNCPSKKMSVWGPNCLEPSLDCAFKVIFQMCLAPGWPPLSLLIREKSR